MELKELTRKKEKRKGESDMQEEKKPPFNKSKV